MSNKVLIKLYDKDETFKKTLSWTSISSNPRYTEAIGYWYQDMVFNFSVDFYDTTINHYDIVKVISWTGTVLYRGVVIGLDRRLENYWEKIVVRCMGMLSLWKKIIYNNWSGYTFTKTADARDIIEHIIDYINSQYTTNPFSYVTNTTTIAGWTTVAIDFDYTYCTDAIAKVLELTNYVFRIDGDGVVYFTPATDTYVTRHKMNMWRHIQSMNIEEKSNKLYNNYVLQYYWAGIQTWSDATSISEYWTLTEYIYDQAISDWTTASERIDAELAKRKDPEINATIVVNDNYNLETLKVWDLITISNMNYSIVDKVIQKIEHWVTESVVYIGSYTSIAKSLGEII